VWSDVKKNQTLTAAQETAIAEILALPNQGKRAAGYGLTLLNKPGRRITAIRRRFEMEAHGLGYNTKQIGQQWNDVKDMAKLEAGAGAGPNIDALVKKNTGFATMDEMLNAQGGYFPSLYVFRPELKIIADEYDRLQEARGDNRRAFRHTA
jgi:hypothetical protein